MELCEVSQPATAGLRRRRDTLPHDAQVLLYRIKYVLMPSLPLHFKYNLSTLG